MASRTGAGALRAWSGVATVERGRNGETATPLEPSSLVAPGFDGDAVDQGVAMARVCRPGLRCSLAIMVRAMAS